MSINDEPTESEGVNEFETPTTLTEAIAGIGDSEAKKQFLEIVATKGLGQEALAVSPVYIQSIQTEIEESIEKAVDPKLKQSLQLKQRVLPQIALAVMLHKAGEDDEASGVLDDVYTMLSQEVDEIAPAYQEYFRALLGLV